MDAIQSRNLLFAILCAVFCLLSSAASAQKSAEKLSKYLQKGEFERVLELSTEEISSLENELELRTVGQILLEDLQFDKSLMCYEKLLEKKQDSIASADYLNYCFCLLNAGKRERLIELGKEKVDSNRWINMLKQAARSQDYFLSKQKENILSLESNIYSPYGFSVSKDTLRYFAGTKEKDADVELEETAVILKNRSTLKISNAAIYQAGAIHEIPECMLPSQFRLRQFAGRQLFVLERSNDVFYSFKSLTNGRLVIEIECDQLTAFPYNSKDYDCAMPVYDEANQVLYFCSNQPGGFGSWDIYSSRYKDGRWQSPENLGEQVNTPFMEIFPQVNAYGLLFASNGRVGAGGFDNYLYYHKDKRSHNLSQWNSQGDDFCLKEIQNTTLGIQNGTLVDYQLSLAGAFADVEKEEKELMAVLYPEKLEAARKVKQKQDSLLKVAQLTKIKKEKEAYQRELIQWNELNKLYFEIEQTHLGESQEVRLDSIIQSIKKLGVKQLFVLAYADGYGTFAYNRFIAGERAFSILDYLSGSSELKGVKFIPVIMGETMSLPDKSDRKTRRVDLRIAKENFVGKGLLAVLSEDDASEFLHQETDLEGLPVSKQMTYVKVKAWHKVAAGQSIGEISLRYNCPIERISKLNNIQENIILLNDYLFIPEDNKTIIK